MKLDKISLTLADGSIFYIDDPASIKLVQDRLPKGITWKRTGKIYELRNMYFGMIKTLNKEAETGYSNTDLHEYIKPLILRKLYDYPHLFKTSLPECSTRNLNIEGWQYVIEQLKVVANDIWGYVFPEAV